jgi:hypothetical protein
MLTFGSLFSGIGGIDLGLERAGLTCSWQVEIDSFCRDVLDKNFPHTLKFDDVKQCGKHNHLLILSVVVSPAKIYLSQVKELDYMVKNQNSGSNLNESFAKWDQNSSSWKMSQTLEEEDSPIYSEPFPLSGMIRNGHAYPLLNSEQNIDEKECLLWPTPMASIPNEGEGVNTWEERNRKSKYQTRGLSLSIAITAWPVETPRFITLTRHKFFTENEKKNPPLKLNPMWVEWLMGFPINWTQIK